MKRDVARPGKKWFTNKYLWLFLMTSLLFGGLYIRYILGGYAYFYTDMGADTFDINYPLYMLFSKVFQSREYSDYFLNVGLGMDMSSYVYQYLNPLNLLVVLLPQRLLPWAVLFATYLKLMIISMFGYKFFHKHIDNEMGSFIAALVWTFSSYIMLWGQHYGFCTSVAMFTVFMYLVYLHTEDRERSRNWLLVLFITLMLFTNYYFLYMSGIIGALYIVIYLVSRKESWKKILKKLAGLGGMGILGICIGGVCLIPTLNIFSGSTRSDAVNMKYFSSMIKPYKPKWLFAFLARFFSNNTLGIADKYSGISNYYEMAMLFTSSLFTFSVPYLLTRKKLRLRTIILTTLSIVALVLPITGKLLTMNSHTQRWCFVLCFLEALAVGVFVKLLITEKNKVSAVISVTVGILFTAVSYALLYWGKEQKYYKKLDTTVLLVCAVFILVYAILILVKSFTVRIDRCFPVILTAVLLAELLAANYPSINVRKSPTRNQVATEYYNDGSAQAAEMLRERDDSVYRVSKTYESASENDGMAQGYNGLSVYLTTNPKELVELKDMYGGTGVSDNFVYFDKDNFIRNSLLGVKYLMANPGDGISEQNYELLDNVSGKDVYENKNALPFGYLYDSKWNRENIMDMTETERTLAAVNGFYFTESKSSTIYKAAAIDTAEGNTLTEQKVTANDCKVNQTKSGITMTEMTDDPNIVWQNVGNTFGDAPIHTITIEVEAPKAVDMALYYKGKDDENFRGDQICIFHINKKQNTWTGIVPGDITDLRLDVSTEVEEVTVKNITVSGCAGDNAAFEKLKNTDIKDSVFGDDRYSAKVNNTEKGTQMLCIPLLYGAGWSASLDGQETALYNINSGLCGVEIPAGEHQVVLTYEIPREKAGIVLTLGGSIVYLLWLSFGAIRRRKNRADF